MQSNLEKYKKDFEKLLHEGEQLLNAMELECYPKEFGDALKLVKKTQKEITDFKKNLPSFQHKYQTWYSESLLVVKFLLPDRVNDFVKLYEKPKGRKEIAYGNYVIEDYLQDLRVTSPYGEVKVDKFAAVPQFRQQLNILNSAKRRFESSLFDIKKLLQADLFDSELEVAEELNKKGFIRAAGAVAGVVLERHLVQVCDSHSLTSGKNPGISDLNDTLKKSDIIEIPQWRFVQHLADLRNLCDHKKTSEPTKDQIDELIAGVSKIIKTLF